MRKPMTPWFAGAHALLLAALATGCGSDDTGGGVDSSEPACKAYCETQEAAGCGESFASCYEFECVLEATPPTACQTARTDFYNCLSASPDICATLCETELNAVSTSCS